MEKFSETRNFINGNFIDSISKKSVDIINPANQSLVGSINEAMDDEIDLAIISGAKERLRAVILTSLTTIGGLTPLLFEGSVQAQFLKPMAITLVFGLMSSTLLVLVFIPVILKIGYDLKEILLRPKFWR